MENLIVGKPQSVEVTHELLSKLNKLIKRVLTKEAAAKNLGISRNTLHTLMKGKTCSPDTLKKLNDFFEPAEQKGSTTETSAA